MVKNLNNNLAEPMVMNVADSLNFCKHHVCGDCYGTLQPVGMQNEWKIKCARCKKLLREGEYITKEAYEQIKVNEHVGLREMRDPEPRMSTEQALKDLGF